MLLLALLFHVVSAVSAAQPSSPLVTRASSSLVGVVLDSDGDPIMGAQVLVADRRTQHNWPLESELAQQSKDYPVQEGLTDLDGRFRVTGLWAGPARVVIRASKYSTLRLGRVHLAARSATTLEGALLTSGETFKGSVTDASALPVGGAKVYSLPRREASRGLGIEAAVFEVETNGLGRFELNSLPLGEWTLLIAAKGHAVQRFEGALLPDDASRNQQQFYLPPKASIHGLVHSLPVVRDLSHLVVRAIPASELDQDSIRPHMAQGFTESHVQEGGSFEIPGLLPDTLYFVRAQLRTQKFTVQDAWSSTALLQSGSSGGRLQWLPSARVSFRALDVASSELAEKFELSFVGASPVRPELSPGPQVKHLIKDVRPTLPGDTMSITAGGPGYRKFESQPFRLTPGQLSEAEDVMLWPHPVLKFQVVDALTKFPIHRAQVMLKEDLNNPVPHTNRMGLTGPIGKVTINDMVGVPRRASASAPGYAPKILISPFELIDDLLRIELERGFDLTATVENSDGEPIPGEGVTFNVDRKEDKYQLGGTKDSNKTAYTDASGVAWFEHLGALEYEFVLASWDLHRDLVIPQKVIPEQGPVRQIRFGIDSRTRLKGRVLEVGLPIAGAEVRCDGLRVRTNKEGEYSFDPVKPSTNSARVDHPDRAATHHAELTLQLTDNELDLQLPLTTIQGVVVDATGQPVANAAIYLADDRWQRAVNPANAEGENLFRVALETRTEPVALSDINGWFSVAGLDAALGVTLSARTAEGFVGLKRVRGIRKGSQITGVELIVQPPAILNIQPLNEEITGGSLLALVATYDGESQAGSWMRVLAPYTGQSWNLDDLPGGRWDITLVALTEFGNVVATDRLERIRIASGEAFDLPLD